MISSSEVSKPWAGMPSSQPATLTKSKKPFVKPFMPRLVRSKTPDHVIGFGSTIQGRFEFSGFLRVEGRFEGVLKPAPGATVAVARAGVVVGDIDGCHSVIVEGTVVGNVTASLADLRRHAHVEGNVWCKDLAAAPTAAFRNRAAVTAAPSAAAAASTGPRRRSSSASRSSSGSFQVGEVITSRAAAAAVMPVVDFTEGSAMVHPEILAPAPSETAAMAAAAAASEASTMGCPVAHRGRAASAASAVDAATDAASVLRPPPPPPPLPFRRRGDDRGPSHSGYDPCTRAGGETPAAPANGTCTSSSSSGKAREGGSVESSTAKRETPPWEPGEADLDGSENESEDEDGRREEGMTSATDGGAPTSGEGEGPCAAQKFSGCPFVAKGKGVQSVPDAQPQQRHVWRDCTKMYGVKCHSLTRAFSAVAVMLKFDEDLMFEEHLQLEYAAENLWFWKRGMRFRSTKFESLEARNAEAKQIYDAFLAVDAKDQVNISHEDREAVLAAVEGRPGAQVIGSGLFDDALIQAENMLALGPFPRFADGTVKNIEKSWLTVLERLSIEDVGETFYSVLFEIAPTVEEMFTRSKRVQGQMLMEIINSSVKLLKNLQDLVPMLIQLGLRHNAYKVKAEHYPLVGDALVATLSLALGKSLTAEIRQSWIAVYTLVSNIMTSMLDEEEESSGDADEASPTTDSDVSRQDSVASLAVGPSAPAPMPGTKNAGGYRYGHGQPSGSSGSSGNTASAVKGMYRRSTNSFRNRFSGFGFVRKDSTNDLANARRHLQHPHQRRLQPSQKPGPSKRVIASGTPSSSTAASTSSSSDSASVAEAVLIGGVAPSAAPPAMGSATRSRGGGRRQGGSSNPRAILGLG